MKHKVVGLGEILWDVFPDQKVLGGAPANFAYHATQLGGEGYVVSAIGNDLLGKEIKDTLAHKKLNHLLAEVDFPTGRVNITLDTDGIPQYEICEEVAWDYIPFNPKTATLAQQTQLVCFGSLAQRNAVSRATIQRFLETMPENSLKIFDINLRLHYYNRSVIEAGLKVANLLKINDEEVVKVATLFEWIGSEQEICQRLLKEYDLKIVILTKGAFGSYVFSDTAISFLASPKVDVVDTVGAGDSFTAAFATAYFNGKTIQEAHQLAVTVAAYVCTQHGAMPIYPEKI